MSKLLAFLTIPVAAGLAVWNLSLSSEIEDLRQRVADGSPTGPADAAKAAQAGDARSREIPRAAQQQISDLAERIRLLEDRLPEATVKALASPAPAAAPAAAPESTALASRFAGGPPGAYGTDAFKGAVGRVLDERESERRKERMERAADGRTRYLLRDLLVTDAQRADVRRLVLESLEKMESVRQDPGLTEEQRREQLQSFQQQQGESIAAVLDAQSAEIVRQRIGPGGVRPRLADGPRRGGAGDGRIRAPGGGR